MIVPLKSRKLAVAPLRIPEACYADSDRSRRPKEGVNELIRSLPYRGCVQRRRSHTEPLTVIIQTIRLYIKAG